MTAATTAVVIAALLFAGSFAWVSTLQTATNQFVQNDYQVTLHDKFDGVDVLDGKSHKVEWTAENEVDKDIWVTNEGSDNIVVRVKLTENMKIKQGAAAAAIIGTANAAHNLADSTTPTYGDACADIHKHVTWTTGGEVIPYSEWTARDGSNTPEQTKKGKFWVIAPDGWAYWMETLAPAETETVTGEGGEEVTQIKAEPGALGNTGKLLDAVALNAGETGHIDYTIKAEMEAIDAGLVGLDEEGTTWTSDYAKILSGYAVGSTGTNMITAVALEMLQDPTIDDATKEKLNASLTATENAKQALAAKDDTLYTTYVAESKSQLWAAQEGGAVTIKENDTILYTDDTGDVILTYMGESNLSDNGVLTIPDGVTIIGSEEDYFINPEYGMTRPSGYGGIAPAEVRKQVKEIVIPEGVKIIGTDVFSAAFPNIQKITLPTTLEEIGRGAFGASRSQPVEIVGLENTKVKTVKLWAFQAMELTNDTLTFPSTLTCIEGNALAWTKGKNLAIAEGATTLSSSTAFYRSAFEEITIPQSVETISAGFFNRCRCNTLKLPSKFRTDYEAGNFGKLESGTVEYYD